MASTWARFAGDQHDIVAGRRQRSTDRRSQRPAPITHTRTCRTVIAATRTRTVSSWDGHDAHDTAAPLDRELLTDALADADLRVLLMCVFHLSGDRRWLADPYRPRRDVKLIADEQAGFPPEIADEIRSAAVALLTADRVEPPIGDPGDELMLEMMRWCMNEPIEAGYAPMMREDLGMLSRDVEWAERPAAPPDRYVVIVGAGASGLILGASSPEARDPVHDPRTRHRRRGHLARQHVSRLRRRHPEPRLLVLDRASPPVDPQLLTTIRAARLPPPMDRRVRPARTHLLRPLGHGSDVERARHRRGMSPSRRPTDHSSSPAPTWLRRSASSGSRRSPRSPTRTSSPDRSSTPRPGRTSSNSPASGWRSSARGHRRCRSCRRSPTTSPTSRSSSAARSGRGRFRATTT